MDILEKWSVIGILVLGVMNLPTTDFTVLQHTNVLGQCFDASICLYCMQHQCLSFALTSCKAQRSPAYESLTETQLQHSKWHWVFQQWGDCSGQSRDRVENLASNLATLCRFSWGTVQPRCTKFSLYEQTVFYHKWDTSAWIIFCRWWCTELPCWGRHAAVDMGTSMSSRCSGEAHLLHTCTAWQCAWDLLVHP